MPHWVSPGRFGRASDGRLQSLFVPRHIEANCARPLEDSNGSCSTMRFGQDNSDACPQHSLCKADKLIVRKVVSPQPGKIQQCFALYSLCTGALPLSGQKMFLMFQMHASYRLPLYPVSDLTEKQRVSTKRFFLTLRHADNPVLASWPSAATDSLRDTVRDSPSQFSTCL